MKIKIFLWLIISQLFVLSISIANADTSQSYRLRQGDLIQVSVWGEDKLQKESLVLPDGSITYPLAGRVEVVGLTSAEVEKRIAEKLKPYLPDPQVSVVIVSITGNVAHVMGKVLKPGQVLMAGPMTVLDALSMAGGLDKFADRNSIKVLRNTPQGQKAIPVYYDQLMRGERLESNITLNPGDTIVVP
ncbi:MAG: polysaccharide biosynthesis/export family protein [Methylotenera sp.]